MGIYVSVPVKLADVLFIGIPKIIVFIIFFHFRNDKKYLHKWRRTLRQGKNKVIKNSKVNFLELNTKTSKFLVHLCFQNCLSSADVLSPLLKLR